MDAICRNRGCITDVREERERKTLAVGAAQERRTASTPPAGACARRPPALRLRGRLRRPGSPALSRARPGRRRLRRPDPARARRRPPTGAGHAARPGSGGGRAPSGPHPGGQLGGPARRGDAGLRATARRRSAARRRSVGGGARAARPAPLAGSAGAVPRRHARLSVPARLRRRHRHDAGGRRPARRGAGRGRAAGPRPPGTRTPTWPGLCPCTQEYAV